MWRESMQARQDLGRYDFGGYVWEYPEVVELEGDCSALMDRAGVEVPGELGMGPTVMPLGRKGSRKIAVVFCRVGLWRGPRGYVLFLDREVWGVPGEGVRKARKVTGRKVEGPEQVTESLEEVFLEAVEENWNSDDQLPGIVSEVVYRHWQELFDFLEPEPQATREETVACYRLMVRLLELNGEKSDDMNWKRLVDRIVIRLNWLRSAPDNSPIHPSTTLRATPPVITTSKHETAARDNRVRSSSRHGQAPQRRVDENQRALDRLSYLGGILIPLPIISSILSMGDTYGPDGSRFFIFWALSVPLAGLTVLLIYADTIRKAEVWVEIEPGLIMPSPDGKATGSSSHDEGMGSGAEVPHNRVLMGRRRRSHEDGEQPSPGLPNSVPFVVDHDVEERIIDMPTVSAPAAQPQTGDGEVVGRVHQRRWSMGWVQVPMLILERPVDGSQPKAWKRKQLGWTGAIRVILYKKFRDGDDIPDGVAACEKPRRGKTKTF
ncbi:hypothetical protein F5144DRAFT_561701 [Chaetomium tenue]|uniref:Uncharacterized protein n=1 Tax=Chaetomium tenue TaxID=1854479 RepID=A0ACB7PID2_9PEZI|nr:hypothetical protein F5144DRAFT_561701 [Chaetomium globosum]